MSSPVPCYYRLHQRIADKVQESLKYRRRAAYRAPSVSTRLSGTSLYIVLTDSLDQSIDAAQRLRRRTP